jgi:hypothetical protein
MPEDRTYQNVSHVGLVTLTGDLHPHGCSPATCSLPAGTAHAHCVQCLFAAPLDDQSLPPYGWYIVQNHRPLDLSDGRPHTWQAVTFCSLLCIGDSIGKYLLEKFVGAHGQDCSCGIER